MKPVEVVCSDCGRDATQARFKQAGICDSCKSHRRRRGEPRTVRKKSAKDSRFRPEIQTCPECGHFKTEKAKTCRDCQLARDGNPDRHVCPGCGGPKSGNAKQCLECSMTPGWRTDAEVRALEPSLDHWFRFREKHGKRSQQRMRVGA